MPPKIDPVSSAALSNDQRWAAAKLGAAVVLHWKELPERAQRILLDQAAQVDEPLRSGHARRNLERIMGGPGR